MEMGLDELLERWEQDPDGELARLIREVAPPGQLDALLAELDPPGRLDALITELEQEHWHGNTGDGRG
jgi:hypothetical protein